MGFPPDLICRSRETREVSPLATRVYRARQSGVEQSRIWIDTHTVERVNQTVLDQESASHDVEDGAALTKHQQRRAYSRQRSIEESQDGGLRQVREEEHAGEYAESQTNGRK